MTWMVYLVDLEPAYTSYWDLPQCAKWPMCKRTGTEVRGWECIMDQEGSSLVFSIKTNKKVISDIWLSSGAWHDRWILTWRVKENHHSSDLDFSHLFIWVIWCDFCSFLYILSLKVLKETPGWKKFLRTFCLPLHGTADVGISHKSVYWGQNLIYYLCIIVQRCSSCFLFPLFECNPCCMSSKVIVALDSVEKPEALKISTFSFTTGDLHTCVLLFFYL